MTTLQNGLVVLFEGVDGVGKSTQLNLAAEALSAEGWPVTTLRNPGGSSIGEALREVMLSPLPRPAASDLYMSMAILAALTQQINEARRQGNIVLVDRSPMSIAAYQVHGSRLDADLAWNHINQAMEALMPCTTFYYKGDVSAALERARQTGKHDDYFEQKPDDYFTRVSEGYAQAARDYQYPVITFNADQPIDVVQQSTMAELRKLLKA